MQRRTLSELQTPDGTTLRFTPLGLGIGYALTPDGSTEYIQELVGRHELVPEVPDSLRQVYERLRTAHTYGILEYDLFTVAESLAYLTFEGALRARFVDAYGGTIPFARNDCIGTVAATGFDDVFRVVRRSGSYSSGWTLLGARNRGRMHKSFNGSFRSLLRWARSEGFLDGQRSRAIENKAITRLRNWIAHPERYHRCSPIDSARTIGDVAEFINRLWAIGHQVVICIPRRSSGVPESSRAPSMRQRRRPWSRTTFFDFTTIHRRMSGGVRTFLCIAPTCGRSRLCCARATWTCCSTGTSQPGIEHRFPSMSCGDQVALQAQPPPGVENASTWDGDVVETVDRVFLVRYPTPGDQPEFPVALERANDVDERARGGQWLVVVADVPGDALQHAHAVDQERHMATGECDDCRMHSHGRFASWDEARAVADHVHAERAVAP